MGSIDPGTGIYYPSPDELPEPPATVYTPPSPGPSEADVAINDILNPNQPPSSIGSGGGSSSSGSGTVQTIAPPTEEQAKEILEAMRSGTTNLGAIAYGQGRISGGIAVNPYTGQVLDVSNPSNVLNLTPSKPSVSLTGSVPSGGSSMSPMSSSMKYEPPTAWTSKISLFGWHPFAPSKEEEVAYGSLGEIPQSKNLSFLDPLAITGLNPISTSAEWKNLEGKTADVFGLELPAQVAAVGSNIVAGASLLLPFIKGPKSAKVTPEVEVVSDLNYPVIKDITYFKEPTTEVYTTKSDINLDITSQQSAFTNTLELPTLNPLSDSPAGKAGLSGTVPYKISDMDILSGGKLSSSEGVSDLKLDITNKTDFKGGSTKPYSEKPLPRDGGGTSTVTEASTRTMTPEQAAYYRDYTITEKTSAISPGILSPERLITATPSILTIPKTTTTKIEETPSVNDPIIDPIIKTTTGPSNIGDNDQKNNDPVQTQKPTPIEVVTWKPEVISGTMNKTRRIVDNKPDDNWPTGSTITTTPKFKGNPPGPKVPMIPPLPKGHLSGTDSSKGSGSGKKKKAIYFKKFGSMPNLVVYMPKWDLDSGGQQMNTIMAREQTIVTPKRKITTGMTENTYLGRRILNHDTGSVL